MDITKPVPSRNLKSNLGGKQNNLGPNSILAIISCFKIYVCGPA